ncbi:phosphatase PAP2 family protein [Roseibium limicola]|uniref:Phosphatase PAP2 family protein n=1 Tax=Roseibium limicola TaxID=2816037 RepID=A0A939EMM4_9HYPH|nr:phosphatase PAP2 family protein [Roseibium limicola]MBO0344626.1 phosphatase PAP2 family protein [Roseibium limicola]
MKANFIQVCRIVSGRRFRTPSAHQPLLPGRRPQDIFAVALLTVGLAIVLFDIPIHPWLETLPGAYRATFSAFTDVGKSHWILWTSGLVCLGLLACDVGKWSFRSRMVVATVWTYAGFLFFTVAASGILAIVLKWCFGRARPKLYDEVGPVAFDPFIFHGAYTSFPSGHSTTVGAIAAALALIFPAWRWLIAAVAFWAAFSRIMVGAHYPSDVVAGMLLGVAFTYFTARFLARRRIGFRFSEAGAIEPILSQISAKAGFRALRSLFSGRRAVNPAAGLRADRSEPVTEPALQAQDESTLK